MTKKNAPHSISIRIEPHERALLESAARQAGINLSDFICRTALAEAEMAAMENRYVAIPAENWEAFVDWMNSPPKNNPVLSRMLSAQPHWEI